ncbi:uncharacterized protein LOC123715146 [Pieris brassicae]|uniref:Uncharacterized protein n=1 Tax=Pieris brassicae TaxID=7116 RepID=A0A9P0XF47_PIEBR|nr:uncharacterized protein LOC123715146 [Pieris brassicae]CAH4032635.1 unnamed protein product [Pieris brassicae]
MFSKALAIFVSVMLIQSITGQSIGVYSPAGLGNPAANAVANTAVAAEAAAVAGNNMAYANAYPANVYNPSAYAPNAYPPCYGNYANPMVEEMPIGPNIPGLTYGLTLADLAASNGGGLRVMSSSPIAPTGITVQSDNIAIEGPLAVSGQLPFLGVVALEGPLPASGQGAVAYGCGNGNVGIVSEGVNEPAAMANPNAYANANAYANQNAYGNPNAYANQNAYAKASAYANAYGNGLGYNGYPAGFNAPTGAVY